MPRKPGVLYRRLLRLFSSACDAGRNPVHPYVLLAGLDV